MTKDDRIADGHRRIGIRCMTTILESSKPSMFVKLVCKFTRYVLSKRDYS